MSERPPEGRPVAESRRLAMLSLARYDRIGAVWDDLRDDEQMQLVAMAERMAAAPDSTEGDQ